MTARANGMISTNNKAMIFARISMVSSSPLPATTEASAAIMTLLALPTVMRLAGRPRQRRS
jgi:hypothetical protein